MSIGDTRTGGSESDTAGSGRIVSKRLALLGIVAALVLMAGCLGALTDDDRGEPADHAPADSDMLLHVDMAVLADEDNQQLIDALADEEDDEVEDQDDLVTEFENETGLDLREAHEVLVFGPLDDGSWEDDGGIIVYSDWETDDLVSAIEDDEDAEYEATEFEGESVLYEPAEEPEFGAPMYIGDLGDGRFVFGDKSGVEASLAVEYGDAEPVSGDVREAYDDARDGHVTLATAVPESSVPTDDPMAPDDIDFEAFHNVSVITTVYDTSDGDAGLELTLYTESEDDALDVKDVIDGGVSLASGSLQDDDLKDQLREIEVEQDGSTVEVSYWGDVDDLVELIEDGAL